MAHPTSSALQQERTRVIFGASLILGLTIVPFSFTVASKTSMVEILALAAVALIFILSAGFWRSAGAAKNYKGSVELDVEREERTKVMVGASLILGLTIVPFSFTVASKISMVEILALAAVALIFILSAGLWRPAGEAKHCKGPAEMDFETEAASGITGTVEAFSEESEEDPHRGGTAKQEAGRIVPQPPYTFGATVIRTTSVVSPVNLSVETAAWPAPQPLHTFGATVSRQYPRSQTLWPQAVQGVNNVWGYDEGSSSFLVQPAQQRQSFGVSLPAVPEALQVVNNVWGYDEGASVPVQPAVQRQYSEASVSAVSAVPQAGASVLVQPPMTRQYSEASVSAVSAVPQAGASVLVHPPMTRQYSEASVSAVSALPQAGASVLVQPPVPSYAAPPMTPVVTPQKTALSGLFGESPFSVPPIGYLEPSLSVDGVEPQAEAAQGGVHAP